MDFKTFKNEYQGIYEAMKFTKQEPEWHAEGDVATHTEMVFDALFSIEEFHKLSPKEKTIVSWAAIFHDLGKIKCTKVIDGVIRSHGHSKLGALMFRELFFDYDFVETTGEKNQLLQKMQQLKDREEIFNLIRFHGYPVHYYKKNEWDIVVISEILNTKLLYILAKADILGRISAGKEEFFMYVEYFKEKAIEYSCFGQRRNWESWRHRRHFLEKGVDYDPYPKRKIKVIMMSGLPGTGKDHYISENFSCPIVSFDDLRRANGIKHGDKKGEGRILQEAKKLMKVYLSSSTDFVFNATNLFQSTREKYLSLFRSYGAKVEIIYLERPLETIQKQNRNREYPLPPSSITNYMKKMEVPTSHEADHLKLIKV